MISLLAQALVLVGTLILIGALLPIRRMMGRLSAGPERSHWYIMLALIVMFLFGYLGYAGTFWNSHLNLFDLIVPGVFFFGSCFVWLTGTLSLQTTIALITAKDTAEKANLYLQAIWDTTPSGIVVLNRETHQIIDANPYARKLLDRTQEELIGRECHSFICMAEKGRCPITDLGQKVDGSERNLVKASGETIPILKTVIPFTVQGHNLLIESFTDIGELKKTQMRLKASIELAEAANQAKSEFLANMSHELRTPLNHIIGFTEMVTDRTVGSLNATQEEFLNDVMSSSRHLLSLINDILDLSKIEAGKLELETLEVPLEEILRDSINIITEKALKHNITLTTYFHETPATIRADERRLKQILYNLLSNAVKFTPDGGKVQLKAQGLNGQGVEITVIDSGIGLKETDLERIFQPFEQADNSAGRKYQGSGLGLSLTRQLVELHGGRIWAESDGEGQGATFRVALPII
jgi:PAS domain S-box-containing protein